MSDKTYTFEEAKRALERYCAYQERCHQEVVVKLKKMGMIPMVIDEVVAHLITHSFLNEARFAQLFAQGKLRIKYWGKQRIRRELQQRQITKRIIDDAIAQLDEEEYQRAFDHLVDKKMSALEREKNPWSKRKKLTNYLLYRGWESDLIYEACQRIEIK